MTQPGSSRRTRRGQCVKNFFLSLAAIVVVFQVFFNFYVIGINHSLVAISQPVLSPKAFHQQLGGYVDVFSEGWNHRNKNLVLSRKSQLELELKSEIEKERSKWTGPMLS